MQKLEALILTGLTQLAQLSSGIRVNSQESRGASAVVRQRGLGGFPHERLPKGFPDLRRLAFKNQSFLECVTFDSG